MIFVLLGVLLAAGVTSVMYYKKSHWIMLSLIVALIALLPMLGNRNRDEARAA